MVFVTIAIIVFFWAVKSNQYDDLDREGINILFDEDLQASPIKEKTKDQQKTTKLSDLND